MQQTHASWVDGFKRLTVLVVGDVVLDRYWWGDAVRLSPEAPVPVLLKRKTTARCGGAANTAANISALGAKTELLGVVGHDETAAELLRIFEESRFGFEGVVKAQGRPTTTKSRVIAGHQHIVRIDEEETGPVSSQVAAELLAVFVRQLESADAVVLSDYAKGLLTFELTQNLIQAAQAAGKPVFVDPKGTDYTRYQGATFLKPNRLELGVLTGQNLRNHTDTLRAGRELRAKMPGVNLLVTEAADGMTCFTTAGEEIHIDSQAREVFDITGAGDTVISAFTLAVASGAPIADAMRIASVAAGITIAVMGVGTVLPEELKRGLQSEP